MHRVVITAIAAITPLGNDAATSWQNLLARKSGIGPITRFDTTGYATRIAGEIKGFDPVTYIPAKQARRMESFCQYAVAAAEMLLANASWRPEGPEKETTGVIIGVGLGGLDGIEYHHQTLLERGPHRLSPFFIPVIIANMASGQVSIFTGAGGPNACTTTACASGTHALGYAFTEILLGRAQAMICGGCESTVTPLAVAGFNALKALSTRNEDPEHASRPFDLNRDGFIIGEGCGLLLMESLEHAEARGARILAEVVGFGASGDAYHMTAPPQDGAGMSRAMRAALRDAKVHPEQVTHINAHGTSTTLNDLCETRAIKEVFGEHASRMPICSNKSQIGHLLGGAGGVEGVFTTLSIVNGIVPATVNLETPDPDCDLDYVVDGPRRCDIQYALSNSFGFGGTNACVLFKKFEA